jgi:ribosomal protein S18 acetylase RimI-like enzyme
MKTYQFLDMNISHIQQIVKLYIERQKLEIGNFMFLKEAIIDEYDLLKHFEEKFKNSQTIGITAFNNQQLVGYLFGQLEMSNSDEQFIWIPYEGIAIKQNESLELIRQLYAKVAKKWVQSKCYTHSVMVPLGNPNYLDAFLHLSFAIDHVHAVMDIASYEYFQPSDNIEIRVAQKDDANVLGEMSNIITSYHYESPVFIPFNHDTIITRKKAFMNLVNEEEVIVLLAQKEQNTIGYQNYEPIKKSLMHPDKSIELSVAGTYPEQTGQGAGKNLMNTAVNLLKNKGFKYVITDWKITNLASASFWPRCGFVSTTYKLIRYIQKGRD